MPPAYAILCESIMNLLLHICCGPCTCYPLKKLRADGIEPTGYFFNPNIHPYQEWERRLKTAVAFADATELTLLTDKNYGLREFIAKVAPVANEPLKLGVTKQRCGICYAWRLEQTAKTAAEGGFDAFSSTLFYSIYQDHELMKQIAQTMADRYGVMFYYEDFRTGWDEGITIAKELELYRQPYCGCVFSEEERYSKAIRKERKRLAREKRWQNEHSGGIN